MQKFLTHLNTIQPITPISKYLVITSGALLLYMFPIFKQPSLMTWQSTICNVGLLICALTLCTNETKQYFKRTPTLPKTIFLSLLLIVATTSIQIFLIKLFPMNDPQNLSRFIYNFSPTYFTHQIIKYIFVGIGEELFKLFIFYVLYWFIQKLTNHSYRILQSFMAITLTSLFFGFLHVPYQPQNFVFIVIPIAVGALINFYFLFQFGSIIPLMIAHAIKDILIFISLMNGAGIFLYEHLIRFILISTILFCLYYLLKAFYLKKL